MHAGLELHDGVDAVALDLELDGLKATGLAGAGIEHGSLPAARLAKALVHLVQVAGEDGRLVATGGGADLDDGVLVVVGVARDEHVLDVFLELGKLGLVFGDVHLEHLLLIGIGGIVQHFLGSLDVIERAMYSREAAMRSDWCAYSLLRRVNSLISEATAGSESFFSSSS